MDDNVVSLGMGRREPPPLPRLKLVGAFWPSQRLSTMLANLPDELAEEKLCHYIPIGAIICRNGRHDFTVMMPRMQQPALPEYFAQACNDRGD